MVGSKAPSFRSLLLPGFPHQHPVAPARTAGVFWPLSRATVLLACLPWARMGWMRRHSTCLKPILGPECAATPCATLARRQMLPHHMHPMHMRTRNLTQVRPGSLTGASNPCPQLTNPEPHLTNPEPHLGDPTNPPNHPPNPTHPAGPGGAQAHAGAEGGGHGACRPGEGPPRPPRTIHSRPPTSAPPTEPTI